MKAGVNPIATFPRILCAIGNACAEAVLNLNH